MNIGKQEAIAMRKRTSFGLLAETSFVAAAACSAAPGAPGAESASSSAALLASADASTGAVSQSGANDGNTRSPIKHVLVIIGENRSFDHVFATYKPKDGEKVWNLLSEGIVNNDGTPGPNFYK